MFFFLSEGIERNLKVWTTDRRCLITRRRAILITFFIVLFIIIYNHPFLILPYNVSYCYFQFSNQSILFSCNEAYFQAYGYKYSLTDLLFIENLGLNNVILPLLILSTNIILIIGLRRRTHQRRHRLGSRKNDDWRERSVVLYMLLSSLSFLFLTAPVGFFFAWGALHGRSGSTNNLAILLDLMEIIHHCSHFPILLMTSSIIRTKTYQIIFQPRLPRQNSIITRQLTQKQRSSQSSSQQGTNSTRVQLAMTSFSTAS